MTPQKIEDRGSIINGACQRVQDFLKSSGALWTWDGHAHIAELESKRLSNFYVDSSPLYTNPSLQDAAGLALSLLADLDKPEKQVGNLWVIAVSSGAIGLAQSIARASVLRPAYVDPNSDQLGLSRFDLGSKPYFYMCDDVVTTGGTFLKAAQAVWNSFPDSHVCYPAMVVVDRREKERLPAEKKDMSVMSLVNPHARTWVNQRALPGNLSRCTPLRPKGNWKKLTTEMLPE